MVKLEFLLIIGTLLASITAKNVDQTSQEKVKIDLKVEFPKNSLLNLVISASSKDLDCNDCIHEQPIQSHHSINYNNEKNQDEPETLEEPLTYTEPSYETTTENPKSISYIRKLIQFCGLDNENEIVDNSNTTLETNTTIVQTTLDTYVSTDLTDEIINSTTTEPITTTTTIINEEKILITTTESLKKSCPNNFKDFNERCIFVSTEKLNWQEAKTMCETIKSKLVTPDQSSYEKVLFPLTDELGHEDFWINAYFNIQFDEWVHPTFQLEASKNSSNNVKDLANEKFSNNQLVYIDPSENSEWFCDGEKIAKYSSSNDDLVDNYLAMSWSSELSRNCINNFNLDSKKIAACELI